MFVSPTPSGWQRAVLQTLNGSVGCFATGCAGRVWENSSSEVQGFLITSEDAIRVGSGSSDSLIFCINQVTKDIFKKTYSGCGAVLP